MQISRDFGRRAASNKCKMSLQMQKDLVQQMHTRIGGFTRRFWGRPRSQQARGRSAALWLAQASALSGAAEAAHDIAENFRFRVLFHQPRFTARRSMHGTRGMNPQTHIFIEWSYIHIYSESFRSRRASHTLLSELRLRRASTSICMYPAAVLCA